MIIIKNGLNRFNTPKLKSTIIIKKKAQVIYYQGLVYYTEKQTYIGGVLVVSLLVVSLFVVSVTAGGGVAAAAAESTLALSAPLLAAFSELQPVAIDPIIAATRAKLKICFFIGLFINYWITFTSYNLNI